MRSVGTPTATQRNERDADASAYGRADDQRYSPTVRAEHTTGSDKSQHKGEADREDQRNEQSLAHDHGHLSRQRRRVRQGAPEPGAPI